MQKEDYFRAENYWVTYDKSSKKMPREDIYIAAEAFLRSQNTCVLSTGCNNFVRATPIEYSFIDGCFYMLSEGGKKFHSLFCNKSVSIAVFEPYKGFGSLLSVQVSGTAKILQFGCDEYDKVLSFKKIPKEAIKNLSHPMYLIKTVPTKFELLFSEFKKNGFDSRQQIDL
jgi:hypothetical protein